MISKTYQDYPSFPGFENVYLEDSYLLGIKENSLIEIEIEAVLTNNHLLYQQPISGEQYCYKKLVVKFTGITEYEWKEKRMHPITDVNGSMDYGNIDAFFLMGKKYHISGEWGELIITSASPFITYV